MEVKSEPQTWSQCFTCRSHTEECMPISDDESDTDSVTLVKMLTKHFWFHRDEFTKAQHVICENCWDRLDNFHRFYQEVAENHRTLNQESSEACEPIGDFSDSVPIYSEIEIKKEENWHHLGSENESTITNEGQSKDFKEQRPSVSNAELQQQIPQGKEADDIIKAHVPYACSTCQKNCTTFYELKFHMSKVHETKACITCCGKRFFSKQSLLEHVLKLTNPNQFKCDVCDKILSNTMSVRKHRREMHPTNEEMKYPCDRCPKRFVRPGLLKYHILEHINLEKKSNRCPHCQKLFASVHQMNCHIKIRHMCEGFVCDVCEKPFASQVGLKRHKYQHDSPEKVKVQCKVCDKWMKNQNSLNVHYLLHTDPRKCNICGLVLEHHQALERHKRRTHKTD